MSARDMPPGGYAFPGDFQAAKPCTIEDGIAMARGMTYRAYAAAHIMAALCTTSHSGDFSEADIADEAVSLADALVARLERKR